MTQAKNKVKLVLFSLFIGTCILSGQKLTDIPLKFKLPLLNDKIYFYFPIIDTISKKSNVKTFNTGHETMLTISLDSITFQFLAREVFKFGGDDLYQVVKQSESKIRNNMETKILAKNKERLLIVSTNQNSDTIVGKQKTNNRLNHLLVRLPDYTLLSITADVKTDKNTPTKSLIDLTEKIFKTIEISKNQRPLKQHTEIIGIRNTKTSFSIPVPDNYGLEVFKMTNNNFQNISFHKYSKFNGNFEIGGPLVIQTGYNPTFRFKELRLKESESKFTELMFLQSKISFLEFESEHGYKIIEQIIDADQIAPNLKIHVCLLSSDSSQIKELLYAIENITINNLPKSSNDTVKFKPYVHNHNYNAIYNNKAKIAKYGLFNQHGDIIDGLNYIYNSRDSLVKIEIYKDASFLRDSIIINK